MIDYTDYLNTSFEKWCDNHLQRLQEALEELRKDYLKYKGREYQFASLYDKRISFNKYTYSDHSFWLEAFENLMPSNPTCRAFVGLKDLEEEIRKREKPDLSYFGSLYDGDSVAAYLFIKMKDFSIWQDPRFHTFRLAPEGRHMPLSCNICPGFTAEEYVDFLICYCDFTPKNLDKRIKEINDFQNKLEIECEKAAMIIEITTSVQAALSETS